MSQLSRPYQIGLGVVALLALVWVVALRGHSSSPTEAAPPAPSPRAAAAHSSGSSTSSSGGSSSTGGSSPSSSAAAQARAAGTPTPIYHGAAPGVEGLTRDIAKAHEAVGTSQREAQRIEHASAQAPSGASAGGGGSSAGSQAAHASPTGAPARTVSTARATKPRGSAAAGRPAQQVAVERALARHRTVVIVFWNPKSAVDAKVRDEAAGLAKSSRGGVVVYDAKPNQVGLFGPVTEVSHVYQTPTILIVNGRGLVSTLTGLTDKFALQQAVREAQHAK